MILDSIIGLFVSLFSFLFEGAVVVFVPVLNLIAAGIELVIGLFVSGFSLGRIKRKKGQKKSAASMIGGVMTLLLLAGLLGWFVVAPMIIKREVTLVAEDGNSLPFAALVIQTNKGEQHRRTDNAGNIKIPRFRTTSITIKDPRYLEKTWAKSEIESELVVERTVLGSGLDSLADKLLKPAREKEIPATSGSRGPIQKQAKPYFPYDIRR